MQVIRRREHVRQASAEGANAGAISAYCHTLF